MMFSKTTLSITLATLFLGLSACTDAQKESTTEAEKEVKQMATEVKEKSVELADDASDMAGDLKESTVEAYEEAKDKAEDVMDSTKDKAAELKTDAAAKLKEACIATKKKMGQDPKDC